MRRFWATLSVWTVHGPRGFCRRESFGWAGRPLKLPDEISPMHSERILILPWGGRWILAWMARHFENGEQADLFDVAECSSTCYLIVGRYCSGIGRHAVMIGST